MLRTYRLVKPVVVFDLTTGKVVTIPVGALVELVGVTAGIGIQNGWWDGHPIKVYEQDLAANSLSS